MNTFAFVEVRHLFKEYRLPDGRLHAALHDLHLDVEAGEFAVVLGPSGCGKTTLLNLLGRLDTEYRGIIRMPLARIGFVFQEPRLLPWMTALDNVRLALDPTDPSSRARAQAWLHRVGLSGYERAFAYHLSVGMQQRVALARAFARQPELLLMDEPFSALDEVTADRVAEHVVALWESTRPAVVLVTHRVEEAVFFADRVWVLTARPGRVAACIAVPLGRPRQRGHPGFRDLVEQVRSALHRASHQAVVD